MIKMKKIYFLLPLAAALTACEDDYFKNNFKEDAEYTISEVVSKDYVLTAEDYASIAGNATNKAIADSLDALWGVTSYSEALADIKKNGYFTELAPAEDYLPVFVDKKWPNADNGSKFNISYNLYNDDLSYIDQLGDISAYTLTEADYSSVWNGRGAFALSLSPMTQLKLSGMVKTIYPDAAEGDIVMVSYAYENAEPAKGSKETLTYGNPYLFAYDGDGAYKQVSEFVQADSYVLASYYDGKYVPFGYTAKDTLDGNLIGNPLSAPDDAIDEENAEVWYVTITKATDSTYYIQNYNEQYISSAKSGSPYYLSDTIPSEGATWLFEPQPDGSFNVINALTGQFVKYAKSTKKYGMYAESSFSNVSVSATHSRLYQYNGSAWLTFAPVDVTVAVFQPSDYSIFGENVAYVENPDAMLPIWLEANYPYASEDVIVAMSYKISSSKCAASTYRKSASGWIKAAPYAQETVVLSKEKGLITAKLSVYIDKTLLGDAGGFTTQNIALDGLNYVWTNTSNYGWKASGYYNTNHTSESWLVSPPINFKNAEAPYLSFDHVYKYLATGDAAEFNLRLGVFASTNYVDDVTTCTWTQIELTSESLPTNQDWTYVTTQPLDLIPFIGGKCWIAFRYTSSNDVDGYTASATWEIKNLLIREPEAE